MNRRVLVIGLDCAPPSLVFDRFEDAMPNVTALRARGTWGKLRSCVPPITVPAWACMTSGRDPGELGLYGFRNRVPGTYELAVATGRDVAAKRLWDLAGEAGKTVAALFVPPSTPPAPVRGVSAACFLHEPGRGPWTFPPALGDDLDARLGPYVPDVPDYRASEPERVIALAGAMAQQHFAIAREVWHSRRPDLMMLVEIGPDRVHHAAWHAVDPSHPRFAPGSALERAVRDYYARLDELVGELVTIAGDETTVLVVSDHGARAMEGGVAVNELLRREGWLVLREEPRAPTRLSRELVDWSRTRAWGEGGYYARVFLNVEGREPQGVVPARAYERERRSLAALLSGVRDRDGAPLGTRVVTAEEVYRDRRGAPPDLLAFFGDLRLRSVGSVGLPDIVTDTNDTGPDACNHDWDGIFAMAGGSVPARGQVDDLSIYDVTPTVLGALGVPVPPGLLGTRR